MLAVGLVGCLGLIASAATAAAEPATQRCLVAHGARVLAGDLATQDPRFAALPAETDLGYNPAPGATREIAVPHQEVPEATFHSEERQKAVICVQRAEAPLSREAIAGTLDLSILGPVKADVLTWQDGYFPEGNLRMPVSGILPPARGTQEVTWRGSIEWEPGRSVAIWARVRLERLTPCARWTQAGRRGAPADSTHLEEVPCDAAAIVAGVLPALPVAADTAPLLLARDHPAGAWLTRQQLTAQPALQRGQRASLIVLSGGVALALPVETEQAGALGEQIWVRSVASSAASGPTRGRKRIRATVTGPGQLQLEAGIPTDSAASRAAGSGT